MILGFGRLGSLAAQLGSIFGLSSGPTTTAAYLDDFIDVDPVGRMIDVEAVGRMIDVDPIGRVVSVNDPGRG